MTTSRIGRLMIRMGKLVGAVCLTLLLAVPGRAATTWSVDWGFEVTGLGGAASVKGRLLFDAPDGPFPNGQMPAFRLDVTDAPGGSRYLGSYEVVTFAPVFSFTNQVLTLTGPFRAYQDPRDMTVWVQFTNPDTGLLHDGGRAAPDLFTGLLQFGPPARFALSPAPVPLPASLPLLLAGLGAVAFLRGRRGRALRLSASSRNR